MDIYKFPLQVYIKHRQQKWEGNVYSMINSKLKEALLKLGLNKDDTVLVHSSLSSLGYVEGGADTVIDTLLDVLSNGTLLMPALSYSTVTEENPVFSINNTQSCVGLISETFRKRAGVIRSMHPTHSVCAMGKYAKEILSHHINSETPVGEDSPFALLPKYHGKILMLGCGLRPNTSFHGIEEKGNVSYVLSSEKREYTLIDENGKVIRKEYFYHYIDQNGFRQRYDRISRLIDLKSIKAFEADCYLIDAEQMWSKAVKKIREDEKYFVEPMGK